MLLGYAPTRAAEAPPHPGSVFDQADDLFRKGRALASQKQFPAAAQEFAAAARLNPKFGAAYYWLGICDFEQEKSDAAIADFKAALVNTRDTKLLSLIHYDLGVQYLKKGARASAAEEYRAAVLLNPALASHPLPAPRTAVPSPPAPAHFVWIIAAPLLILPIAIALAAWRIDKKTVGDLAPGSGPGHDELLRLTASWSPEPELITALVPRPIRFFRYKRLIGLAAVAAAALLIMARPLALIERWVIMKQGIPGTATVQQKYQTTHYTKHGHYYLQHLTLAYSPAPDSRSTADAVVGDSSSVTPGQELPIHSLNGRPGWVALDDDFGYSSKQGAIALTTGSCAILVFAVFLLILLPGIRKERALLRTGQARAAYVERVQAGSRGFTVAFLTYEFMGGIQRVRSTISSQNLDQALQAGQVVTVLVDPEDPRSFAIYKASSYRVVPT